MQQDLPTSTPLATTSDSDNMQNSNNTKNTNAFKIMSIVASIAALCGIAFGVFCIVQICQKDKRIGDLEAQLNSLDNNTQQPEGQETENNDATTNGDSDIVENLYMIGDVSTKRKYYLGTTDLDPGKDAREKDMYIIDVTQLRSANGAKKYDLKPILERAVANKVLSLPDILAEGTVNATPKTSCQSYKMTVLEPNNLSDGIISNWTTMTDWSDLLPLGIYVACMTSNGTELSLGSELYSLNPNTNELFLVNKGGITKVE